MTSPDSKCKNRFDSTFLSTRAKNFVEDTVLLSNYKGQHLAPIAYVSFVFFRYYGNCGTKCTACLQLISPKDLVMRAAEHVYHVMCFNCTQCGHQLRTGDEFLVREGQLFCRYEKEYCRMISPQNEWCPAFSPKCKEH